MRIARLYAHSTGKRTGADCLGYRAFVELTGSDEGFFKLNDPTDAPFADSSFDIDGDGSADDMWRFRIVNSTWSRQSLSFGTIGSESGGNSADFNGDGAVDLKDFFLFAEAFGNPATGDNAIYDLGGNGEIDLQDFFLFAESFGQ